MPEHQAGRGFPSQESGSASGRYKNLSLSQVPTSPGPIILPGIIGPIHRVLIGSCGGLDQPNPENGVDTLNPAPGHVPNAVPVPVPAPNPTLGPQPTPAPDPVPVPDHGAGLGSPSQESESESESERSVILTQPSPSPKHPSYKRPRRKHAVPKRFKYFHLRYTQS